VHVLRQEGLRALVFRAAGETVYRRLVLLERDAKEPLPAKTPSGLEFRFLDERALDEYDALRPGHRGVAAARLADGHRCFGSWSDGRLVAVRWLATGSPQIEYLGLPLHLADGEIYHYDSFTAATERRRGISLASQAAVVEALRREGCRHFVRTVLPENRAAVADAARAGFRPCGRVGYVKLGPWKHVFRTDVG
jgi:GNAT superfamily N-acetyltransferase